MAELKQPLEHANHILSTFTQVRLHRDPYGGLWVVGPPIYRSKTPQKIGGHVLCRDNDWPRRAFPARVKNDWPAFDYGKLEMGGTEAQAVADLINWLRGKDIHMAFWRYAAQDNVRGINCLTLELLKRYGCDKEAS